MRFFKNMAPDPSIISINIFYWFDNRKLLFRPGPGFHGNRYSYQESRAYCQINFDCKQSGRFFIFDGTGNVIKLRKNAVFPLSAQQREGRRAKQCRGESTPPCICAHAFALISRAYLPTRSTLRWTTFAERKEGRKLNLMTFPAPG